MTARHLRVTPALPLLLTVLGILVAFVVRIAWLGDQDLWWDEGLAIWAVRQPVLQTTSWTAADVHPPLYFWLLWIWVRLAGDTPFAMRYLTLVLGTLTVALGYAVGRRLGGNWTGVLAVWMMACSRFMVWWSQEMRMYMLAALLSLLALYAVLRFLDQLRRMAPLSSTWRELGVYVPAAVGSLYTIYLSSANILLLSILVALAGAADLAARRWRRAWFTLGAWTIANLIVIALVIPWLVLAFGSMRSWSVATPTSLLFPFHVYGALLATGISTNIDALVWAIALIAGVLIGGVIAALTVTKPANGSQPTGLVVVLIALTVFLPPIILYVLTQPVRTVFYVPRLEARYFVPFAPYFLAGLAWVVVVLWRTRRALGFVAALIVLGVFIWHLPSYYAGRHLSDGYPSLTRTIRAYAQPGDGVVLISGDRYPLFLYEYDRDGLSGDRPPVVLLPAAHSAFTPENVEQELAPLLSRFSRLWLVLTETHLQDPNGLALPWLQAQRQTLFDQYFNSQRLVLLGDAQTQRVVSPRVRPQFHLPADAGGRIIGYDLPVRRAVPGKSVYQAIYMRLVDEHRIQVAWRHESGRELMPRSIELPTSGLNSAIATTATSEFTRFIVDLPVFSATPAGQYELLVRWSDGAVTTVPGPYVDGSRPLPALGARIEQPAQVGPFELLGFFITPTDGALSPGGAVTVRLDWRIHQPLDGRYTFFVHLLGEQFNPATNGPVWAGQDSEPLGGGLPTVQWWSGEVIPDEVRLNLPNELPAGAYHIEIGAYLTADPQRLPVAGMGADPDNRRILLRTTLQRR
ncbi:MAG: glycosyltransferase family 39 protein [Anaerolineae bacterium]|nr:glycosyltransferase family 39 protein [Thermoflexales bacterium]MDW8407386.1 glycosyltransferase family 39 protein [Anaerolineae bacterium]